MKKYKDCNLSEKIILNLALTLIVFMLLLVRSYSNMSKLSSEKDLLLVEYDSTRIELINAEKAVSDLQSDNSELVNDVTELESQIDDMMAEVDRVRGELEEYRKLKLDPNDITIRSNIDYHVIDEFLLGTNLYGLGSSYVKAEKEYGVNAIYLMSLTILESGYGTSSLAIDKNNISGFTAYDTDPYNDAKYFNSKEECILMTAKLLRENYIDIGLLSLEEINSKYASDNNWHKKISTIGSKLYDEIR